MDGPLSRRFLAVTFFSLSSIFCNLLCLDAAVDSIRPGVSVNDTQTLVSAEGIFELGFFTSGPSRGRYLGIWYHKILPRVVVWVANRRQPVPDNSGVLTLSEGGALTLSGNSSAVFWSTKTNGSPSRPVARLLDNGNFVVGGESSGGVNAGSYFWQSFDYPGDTMLPGMRIGIDRRRGLRRNITASRSSDDPSPGNFSYIIDPSGVPQLALTEGGRFRWRGGPWVGERFLGIPEMRANPLFIYGFVSDDNEVYFKFEDWNRSFLSRLVINDSGVAHHYTMDEGGAGRWELVWQSPNEACDRMAACGANAVCDPAISPICRCLDGFQQKHEGGAAAAAAGCVREEASDCRSGAVELVKVSGVKWPDTSTATVNLSAGFDDCQAACQRDCNCTAMAISDRSGCVRWSGDLIDIRVFPTGGQDLYVRVAARSQGGERRMTKAMTTVIACLAVVIVLLAALWWFIRRRARRLTLPVKIESCSNYDSERAKEFDLPMFHLHSIVAATKNFSFQNKLGEGGFGPVYQGNLSDGQSIAAKRLSTNSGQGLEEFKSEIKLLANLQHTNLVKLLGCCIDGEEKILIYEYMANQSLDKFIFDPRRRAELDWPKRANIIEGIAQGLLYLHRYSRVRVIHRDLKASNILLDGEWNPKISDFGLARIFSWNDDPANTKHIVGTYGYISPEYAMKGHFSVKSDVFSYGILVLEILSGKRNTSTPDLDEALNLSGHAWKLWRSDSVMELMDPALAGTCSAVEFSRCVHVALLCVQENPADRPNMLDVVSMLNNESSNMLAPNRPAYLLERLVMREDGEPVKCRVNSSTNEITHSEMRAR